MKRIVDIFSSPRREGMYIYLDHGQAWDDLPETLRQAFGAPRPVMTLVVTPERRLARVSPAELIAAIEEKGFFLQMPPVHRTTAAPGHDA